MRDIVLNLSEQTLSKIGNCDYSNIVRGSNNYPRIVLKTDIQWNNMAKVVTVRTLGELNITQFTSLQEYCYQKKSRRTVILRF